MSFFFYFHGTGQLGRGGGRLRAKALGEHKQNLHILRKKLPKYEKIIIF